MHRCVKVPGFSADGGDILYECVIQCVCNVLQCDAVGCSVLQRVAVFYSAVQLSCETAPGISADGGHILCECVCSVL